MACPTSAQQIESNFTGLRYAFEVCIGNLPGDDGEVFAADVVTIPPEELSATTPTWHVIEPNSYGDFGVTITNTQRTPIVDNRQREKGVTTDLDAVANFQIDYTGDNFERLAPTFFFAGWRRSGEFGRDSAEDITSVSSNVVSATGIDTVFQDGSIVIARNFDTEANNSGVRLVTDASVADQITVASLLDDTVTDAAAYLKEVGIEGVAGDIDVDASGSLPALTSTILDFTTLPLVVGQWVFVGCDDITRSFTNAGNTGFARVASIAANRLEFDKTQNTMVTEDSTTETIHIYYGDLIKNENSASLIQRQTVQFERSLSTAGYEYVIGGVANQLTINLTSADKITADLAFIGIDGNAVGTAERKSGNFPDIDTDNVAFNASSDFSRIRLANQDALDTPLFAFITEATLSISNNATPSKAVGTLGAFEVTSGDFTVEGSITAYFSDVAAIQAVRNNEDVTLDFIIVQNNVGWVFDIPLLSLGEGRLNVEKDAPITLPLSVNAARDPSIGSTLQTVYFPYLPTVAEN